ncbi:hypothetical protein C1645_830308, partial [Glomus cerebriforme]
RRNTQGRRTAGVVRTKLKDYNQKKVREKRIRIVDQPTEPAQSVMAESSIHKDKLPDDVIADVREDLSDIWTIKKVREW